MRISWAISSFLLGLFIFEKRRKGPPWVNWKPREALGSIYNGDASEIFKTRVSNIEVDRVQMAPTGFLKRGKRRVRGSEGADEPSNMRSEIIPMSVPCLVP